jgi:hypothetical protein
MSRPVMTCGPVCTRLPVRRVASRRVPRRAAWPLRCSRPVGSPLAAGCPAGSAAGPRPRRRSAGRQTGRSRRRAPDCAGRAEPARCAYGEGDAEVRQAEYNERDRLSRRAGAGGDQRGARYADGDEGTADEYRVGPRHMWRTPARHVVERRARAALVGKAQVSSTISHQMAGSATAAHSGPPQVCQLQPSARARPAAAPGTGPMPRSLI